MSRYTDKPTERRPSRLARIAFGIGITALVLVLAICMGLAWVVYHLPRDFWVGLM